MLKKSILKNLGLVCLVGFSACGSAETTPEENNKIVIEEKIPEEKTEVEKDLIVKDVIGPWVVSADVAKSYLDEKGGMILDTRPKADFENASIAGSQNVDWRTYSMVEESERGELLEFDKLAILLDGLTESDWVFVIGDPVDGWGEDGRIAWMLQALGHKNAAFVDGGFPAAKSADLKSSAPKEEPSTTPSTMGDDDPVGYQPSVSAPLFSAEAADVKAAIDSDVQIIDVREKREYDGETPYGETRGGHVPTALHLHYKDLLDEDGKLLSRTKVLEVLASAGIDPALPSIAYCTGGVRSAWLTAVLVAMDLDVKNYAGSMWQWASYPADEYPLEK